MAYKAGNQGASKDDENTTRGNLGVEIDITPIDKDSAGRSQSVETKETIVPGALVKFKSSIKSHGGGVALVIDRGEFPLHSVIHQANPACWPDQVSMLYVQWLHPIERHFGQNFGRRRGTGEVRIRAQRLIDLWIQLPEMWEDRNGKPYGAPYHCKYWPGDILQGWVLERSYGFPGKEVGNLVWEVVKC
tara:strand:- start:461 stop:1027 length:567 start_codon:yes stop_codon:yes gene_type:complete